MEYQRNFDKTLDRNVMVVEFPCQFPKGTILASQVSAIDQLEYVKRMQTDWSDNAVSVTVYYRMNELPSIQEWLKKHYATSLKSVSFLLHSDHGFDQAPYSEISEDEYFTLRNEVSLDVDGSHGGESDILDSFECAGGVCPIR